MHPNKCTQTQDELEMLILCIHCSTNTLHTIAKHEGTLNAVVHSLMYWLTSCKARWILCLLQIITCYYVTNPDTIPTEGFMCSSTEAQ